MKTNSAPQRAWRRVPAECVRYVSAVQDDDGYFGERIAARYDESSEPNPLVVDALEIDQMFGTTVPGLFAAGDVSPRMPSVANAVAAGSSAAAMIVHDLMNEAHGLSPVG